MPPAPAWISTMWPSATSSERVQSRRGVPLRLAGLLVAVLWGSGPASSAGLVSVEEALASAFPGATHERETVFLTAAQLAEVGRAVEAPPTSAMVTRFRILGEAETIGWAYLDTHRVRTLPETVMVIIAASGSITRVEVVAFREPLDYLPPRSWYAQFDGQVLGDELALKRSIRPITGATLSARAATEAVRRVLAIHAAISGREEAP